METPTNAKLYLDQDMAQGQILPFVAGQVAVFSARAPSKTSSNEDSTALIPLNESSGALAVADGMGGAAAGERASELAVTMLQKSLSQASRDDVPMRAAILNGIEAANRAIAEMANGARTTLAVVEIQADRARPYHVGDSMILLVGQRGRIKMQTVSHSPVGYAVEAGVLDQSDAMHHEDRHVVSNVMGAADMRIEVGSVVRLAPRDTLLLASDGLFDNLHVEEIVESLRKGPLDQVAERLWTTARQRMNDPRAGQPSKLDDLTFIVYRPSA